MRVQGKIISATNDVITIRVNADAEGWCFDHNARTVEVRIDDGRSITSDQRRKIYATLRDIADWIGDMPDSVKASYPSSTTMLVMCVTLTAIMQFNARIKNDILKRCVTSVISIFSVFMVIVRLISGVHWLTDIIGGALLSAGLVLMYRFISSLETK